MNEKELELEDQELVDISLEDILAEFDMDAEVAEDTRPLPVLMDELAEEVPAEEIPEEKPAEEASEEASVEEKVENHETRIAVIEKSKGGKNYDYRRN